MKSTFSWAFSLMLMSSGNVFSQPADLKYPMEYVNVCKAPGDCKNFSRLVMGTDHLIQGGWVGDGQPEISEEEAFKVLDEAVKYGINFFDTSPIYVGSIEYRLGKWRESRRDLARSANPDGELYVLSKGGFPFDLFWSKSLEKGEHSKELKEELKKKGILDEEGSVSSSDQEIPLKNVPAGTYSSRLYGDRELITERVAEELGHSRRNLNDDITVYLMHRDDGDAVGFKAIERPKTPVQTIMEALASDLISQNFWMLGWSNWETPRVNESVSLAKQNPELPTAGMNSPYFSLFEMSSRSIHALGVQVTHKEMMDPNFQKGIKIMPYSPLGGFSILDKPEPRWENAKKDAKAKYDNGDPYWQNVFHSIFTDKNEGRWRRVVKFTEKFNQKHGTSYTIDQMLNAYVLAHPRTDLLAIGPITGEQLQRTVKSLELSKKLTSKDLDYLYSGKK